MSTPSADESVDVVASPRHAHRASVAGRTDIADRVVEKVVAHSASRVEAATGTVRHFAGIPLGRESGDRQVRASAEVHGGVVEVSMTMSVQWPASVRAVTREVRDHVCAEVTRLTGMRVAQVDIAVATLPVPSQRIERRVR